MQEGLWRFLMGTAPLRCFGVIPYFSVRDTSSAHDALSTQ